ncbi:SusD/RagB family nutrient-binding outer membrane lipoprotein [Flexithrix dorotheae]|uniref:SusD/RagB family nutrient-binding outer membrane lipoprotein n=1 Tax=Flexithrix dorotheae TaxID=70993 RepID=UPI00036D13C4|nr:SusD/RagB family nutrient-binding outer membrane lipoprotein [Flexithrix dorotheae]
MKFKDIKTAFLWALLIAVTGACTDDFEEINTDPNLVTKDKVNPDAILTYVLKESIFDIIDFGRIGEYAGYVSNPSSGFPLQNVIGSFDDYRAKIVNVTELERLTAEDPTFSNKNAIAKIWKAWLFYRMTDNLGDVPYTEAALAFEEIITKPKYDEQEFIYKDLLNTLKEAAAQLRDEENQKSYGTADILFQGDIYAWERFANSLRFRLAMRVRYVDAGLAQQHISEVINSPLIDSNDQNAELTAEGDDAVLNENRGPFYNYVANNNVNPLHPSMTVSENLLQRNDPRLSIYLTESEFAGYRSRPFNMVSETQKPRYSGDSITKVGETFLVSDYTFKVFTAAEVKFLKAEAALAGIISGDQEDLFQQGIQDAMALYSVSQDSIDAYLASPYGSLSGTEEEQLEEIIVQKYLANYYQTHEAWAEYRRTGYPKIWIGDGPSDTGGQLPRRQMYPLDEHAKNLDNMTTAAKRLANGDDPMSKVWWDAKPGLPYAHPKQGQFPPEE